jgi:hypothetical protein
MRVEHKIKVAEVETVFMAPAACKRAVNALAVLIAEWEKKNLRKTIPPAAEPNPVGSGSGP